MMQKEVIYNMMNGFYDSNAIYLKEYRIVEDEFADGKECGRLCEKMYQARMSLSEKLGSDEDQDLEIIIDSMNKIVKILCMKMYDYGRDAGIKNG